MQSSRLRIDLLGGFRVSVGDAPVGTDAWRRRKPAALVKILALTPGHRVHREQLMELLWPDLDAAPAGANLRKAIYQARGALDGVSHGAARLIEFVGDVVSLATEGLVVDIELFRSVALAAARRAGDADALPTGARRLRQVSCCPTTLTRNGPADPDGSFTRSIWRVLRRCPSCWRRAVTSRAPPRPCGCWW